MAGILGITRAWWDAMRNADPAATGANPFATEDYVAANGGGGGSSHAYLTGTAAPTAGDGADGDYWFWAAAGLMYGPKAAGAWPDPIAVSGRLTDTLDAPGGYRLGIGSLDPADPWIAPFDCIVFVELVSGGGGGGGAGGATSNAAAGGGGSSGGYISFYLVVSEGDKLTATWGDGGTGGSTSGGNGGAGGETTLVHTDADDNPLGTYTAPPGLGGSGMAAGTTQAFARGGLPAYSGANEFETSQPGADSMRLGVSTGQSISGTGGSSPFGSGGGGRTIAGTGLDAAYYGGGGGGGLAIGATGRAGGAGAPGIAYITLYRR